MVRSAEVRLTTARNELPAVTPFGPYVPTVQTGNLLLLSGMLPTVGHEPEVVGRVGKEVDVEQARSAAHAGCPECARGDAATVWATGQGLSSGEAGVYIAIIEGRADLVRIADAASEVLRDVFGEDKIPARLVIGVESLQLGVPVELETIFEVLA